MAVSGITSSRWQPWLCALGVLLGTLVVQWSLRPVFGPRFPFLFFLPAIGIAAMWCGWRPALMVLIVGLFNSLYWINPSGQWWAASLADRVATVGYLMAGAILLALGGRLHQMRHQAEDAEARLGQQLQQLQALHDFSRLQQEQMRQADQRKDEFLATLAHELRNPLAPIRQATLIARSPNATEAQKRWSHEIIERQIGHMALLLDDLLDVSRITRGKLELRKVPTSLASSVSTAVETARPLIDARKQRLSVELPAQELWLDADPVRLAQILSNLLTNAAKYGKQGGQVQLRARQDRGNAVIEISDDGIGIPAVSLDAIFEMFAQLPPGNGRSQAGLGIGLALSRGLAELHGGHLTVRSDGPNRGSVFTVELPLGAAGPAQTPAPAQPQAHGAAWRVLVADDNRDAAESLAEVLRMRGHDVAVAFDGADALRQFEQAAPEVALLDIGMPRMSGNEVASAIRATPQGRDTVLVAITGWGQERDRCAAREAGFDQHFTKPVDPARVLEFLEEIGH